MWFMLVLLWCKCQIFHISKEALYSICSMVFSFMCVSVHWMDVHKYMQFENKKWCSDSALIEIAEGQFAVTSKIIYHLSKPNILYVLLSSLTCLLFYQKFSACRDLVAYESLIRANVPRKNGTAWMHWSRN